MASNFARKKVVVIGACTSGKLADNFFGRLVSAKYHYSIPAHDITADVYHAGIGIYRFASKP